MTETVTLPEIAAEAMTLAKLKAMMARMPKPPVQTITRLHFTRFWPDQWPSDRPEPEAVRVGDMVVMPIRRKAEMVEKLAKSANPLLGPSLGPLYAVPIQITDDMPTRPDDDGDVEP